MAFALAAARTAWAGRRPGAWFSRSEYFAHNRWVDTPSSMLAPKMVRAIEGTGAFHAVLAGATSATGQLRLETEIVRLQQDFSTTSNQVRLRAVLVDTATGKVLASREFDARVDTTTDDPYGGVIAAQRAVSQVVADLASFCARLDPLKLSRAAKTCASANLRYRRCAIVSACNRKHAT